MQDILSGYTLFKVVVEQGSFAAAARKLDLSPSAVSKAISRIEQRLDARLFSRTTRSIKLTQAGTELYQRVQAIVAAVDEAELVVGELASAPRGDLRVVCSDAFAKQILVPMWQGFRHSYPRLRLHVLQGDGPIDLRQEDYDVAIRFAPPEQQGFAVHPLLPDPWVVCAAPDYLSSAPAVKRPVDLLRHDCLVIRARGQLDNRWQFTGGARGLITVEPVFSGIGMVVKQAALAGMGVARLAQFLVRQEVSSGQLVRVLDSYQPVQQRNIYAVCHDRTRPPRKVEVFVDGLRQHLSKMN